MKKFLDIKGLSVADSRGITRGVIEDGVVDIKNNKLCSLIISQKGIIASYYLLSLKNIVGFGNIILSNDDIYKLNRAVVKKNRGSMMTRFLGKEVYNSSGKALGNLADVIFDEKTGEIKALLCTKGLLEDILDGRRLVIADGKTHFGVERILVGEEGPDIINDASLKKFVK